MEGGYYWNIELARDLGCQQAEHRVEPTVHVHDVDLLSLKDGTELAPEPSPCRNPGEGPGAVDDPAGAHATDVLRIRFRLLELVSSGRQPHVRGNHDGRVSRLVQEPGQIVNVLGDAAEMWIVELRDERD